MLIIQVSIWHCLKLYHSNIVIYINTLIIESRLQYTSSASKATELFSSIIQQLNSELTVEPWLLLFFITVKPKQMSQATAICSTTFKFDCMNWLQSSLSEVLIEMILFQSWVFSSILAVSHTQHNSFICISFPFSLLYLSADLFLFLNISEEFQ